MMAPHLGEGTLPKPSGLAARMPLLIVLVVLIVSPAVVWKLITLARGSVEVMPVSMSAVAQRVEAARGEVSVLYVYASWCPSCQTALPTLNRVVRRFEDRGVSFTVVSIDKDLDALQELLDVTGAAFDPLCVPAAREGAVGELLESLGAKPSGSIPYGVVFDREGAVYREWTGWHSMDAWDGALEELL